VTSRPAACTGEAQLPFEHARIEPLDDEAIGVFLRRWCGALYPESTDEAEAHGTELSAALQSRREIRRLARNPVMLTALAVVHWNERRLPEQRAELYDSILRWLARSREQRPGRPSAERCLALLQELALSMQNHPEGRQVQLSRRLAAEALAPEFGEWAREGRARPEPPTRYAIEGALRFLEEEELDSGIVVGPRQRGLLLAPHLSGTPRRPRHRGPTRSGARATPLPRSGASILPAGMARGGALARRRLAPAGAAQGGRADQAGPGPSRS